MTEPIKSDGGSSAYYELPADAAEIMDLIEARNLPFWQANCLKAIWRIGQKDGVDEEYDLRKIIYFANRRLKQIAKERAASNAKKVSGDFERTNPFAFTWDWREAPPISNGFPSHRRNVFAGYHDERFSSGVKLQENADANIAQGLPATYGLIKDLD